MLIGFVTINLQLILVGVAVDPADPDTVIVSATDGPESAHSPRRAESYVYRKTELKRWEQAMSGLPEAKGTTANRFATHAGESGVIYAPTTAASSYRMMQDGRAITTRPLIIGF